MINNLILTKNSSENEILTYFEGVRSLVKNNEEFPVNLDDVWPLIYAEKGIAVRSLKKNFIKDVDYVTVDQKVNGGKFASTDYHLTVSCMEYFVARKVRPVFDVYRRVFHKTANMFEERQRISPEEMFLQSAQLMLEHSKRLASVENRLDKIETEKRANTEMLLKIEVSANPVPEKSLRSKINRLVRSYSEASDVDYRAVWQRIYQDLYDIYHINLKARKHTKKESNLDVAERIGCMDKIYDIVSAMTNGIVATMKSND